MQDATWWMFVLTAPAVVYAVFMHWLAQTKRITHQWWKRVLGLFSLVLLLLFMGLAEFGAEALRQRLTGQRLEVLVTVAWLFVVYVVARLLLAHYTHSRPVVWILDSLNQLAGWGRAVFGIKREH